MTDPQSSLIPTEPDPTRVEIEARKNVVETQRKLHVLGVAVTFHGQINQRWATEEGPGFQSSEEAAAFRAAMQYMTRVFLGEECV